MSHLLTTRNLSALAKLDLGSLGHAQRLEAMARALGYGSYAAFKANEIAQEAQEAQNPVHAVIAFGTELTSAIDDGEPLHDDEGFLHSGEIIERSFASAEILDAYLQGLMDGDGWSRYSYLGSTDMSSQYPFFAALQNQDNLTFETAYTAWQSGMKILEESYEDEGVLGLQIRDPNTGDIWADRPASTLLHHETAYKEFEAAQRAGEMRFMPVPIRKGAIENPDFA